MIPTNNKSRWTIIMSMIISLLLLSNITIASDAPMLPDGIDAEKIQQARQQKMIAQKKMAGKQLLRRAQLRQQKKIMPEKPTQPKNLLPTIDNPLGNVKKGSTGSLMRVIDAAGTSVIGTPIDVQVNGADQDSVFQGGVAIITVIFSTDQTSAEVSEWVDMDGNGLLDPTIDLQLDDTHTIYDNDGVDDEDITVGVFQTTFDGADDDGPMRVGNFGILLLAVDAGGADTAFLYIKPLESDYSVSGSVTPTLANIIIIGFPNEPDEPIREDEPMPWITVTDGSGNYELMLLDPGYYDIMAGDFLDVTGGMYPDTTYDSVNVDGHLSTPYNFIFTDPTSGVDGFVLAYPAMDPVVDVDVWVEDTDEWGDRKGGMDRSALTDAEGYYVIGLQEGWHRVGVDSDDLIPNYLVPKDSLIYAMNDDTTEVNFDLVPTDNMITGTVFMNGVAFPGVLVGAWSSYGWTEAESGSDGSYQLSVSSWADADCGYDVGIWDHDRLPPGTVVLTHTWCVPSDSTGLNIYLETYDGGVEGYITDATTGDTLSWEDDVWIDVWNDDDFHAGTGPDDNGYFLLPLPPGSYYINASGRYYLSTDRQPITITNQVIPMDFALEPVTGAVEGYVFDTDGVPIPWAQVDIWNWGSWYGTGTDEFGYFYQPLPDGMYLIEAGAEGFYWSETNSLSIEGDMVYKDFFLIPMTIEGSIAGYVYDDATRSTGIVGAFVSVSRDYPYFHEETTTDANGYYEIGTPFGLFDVYASAEDYSNDWVEIGVSPDNPNPSWDFYLHGISLDAGIEGYVLDMEFQTPIPNAEVEVWSDYFYDYVYTDYDGYFIIDTPVDSFWVSARADDYHSMGTVLYTTPGETSYVEIELPKMEFRHPELHGVWDVPNDQGRQVRLIWSAGAPPGGGEWDFYSIWRKVNHQGPMRDVVDLWDFIAQVPFHGFDDYSIVAPTVIDSNHVTGPMQNFWSTFIVTAHRYISYEDRWEYYDSNWMEGYSKDDLIPMTPTNLVANNIPSGGIELTWDEIPDEDFEYFSIYRGLNVDFVPVDPIGYSTEISFLDGATELGVTYYYVLTATDNNGNESEFSAPVGLTVLSVGDLAALPEHFELAQNYPNPFNPATTIEYAMPEAGQITVKVYNLLGVEVAILVNDFKIAGRYNVQWQAGDLASGVYLVQMRSNDFTQTRKVMLMK